MIIEAKSKDHIEAVRSLFLEYAQSLDFNICFHNFNKELNSLPGEYSKPRGCILLAKVDAQWAGCVALRELTKTHCEMVRLYVGASFRGKKLGRKLAEAAMKKAQQTGYTHMRLHTLHTMKEAYSLYRSLGFKKIGPYMKVPVKGAVYMEIDLCKI
jgi:putative acetyltransferase